MHTVRSRKFKKGRLEGGSHTENLMSDGGLVEVSEVWPRPSELRLSKVRVLFYFPSNFSVGLSTKKVQLEGSRTSVGPKLTEV